MKEVK